MKPYQQIDHTADIGIRVEASSLQELFEACAFALFDLQFDLSNVAEKEFRSIEVTGMDLENVLIRWLQRMLVLHEIEGLVCCRFQVDRVDEGSIAGTVWGESLDLDRHELKGQIKAVTYHGLEIKESSEAEGWEAQIIFDV